MNEYENYDDLARLEYGRMLWRNAEARERLLRHWMDPRHPYRERFLANRDHIERVLMSDESASSVLDAELTDMGLTLRTVVREIPPVFGSFWPDSA